VFAEIESDSESLTVFHDLFIVCQWPAQSLRIMISSSTPAKQYDSWSMYDLSSSPSTTVSSTLKTLNSRFEHPTNSRNDEEIPASWSGMWGTWSASAAMTKANGRAARGVHGRSFSASPASATPSWALQHSLSMSTSINKKNSQYLLCGSHYHRLPEIYHPVQHQPQMARHHRRVRHLRDCRY
jgi:hypothetical protein